MMGHREPCKGGDEYDVFTGWRKVLAYCGRPGRCRRVKRAFNRRIRRDARLAIKGGHE